MSICKCLPSEIFPFSQSLKLVFSQRSQKFRFLFFVYMSYVLLTTYFSNADWFEKKFIVKIFRVPTDGNAELNKYNNSQPPIKKLRIPTSALQQHAEDSDSSSSTSTKKKIAGSISPTTPSKGNNKARSNGGKKRAVTIQVETVDETQITPKKTKLKIVSNGNVGEVSAAFECPEPNCGKKYKNKNGLSYHQRTSHVMKKPENFEEKVYLHQGCYSQGEKGLFHIGQGRSGEKN